MTQLLVPEDKRPLPDGRPELREKLAPLTSLRFFAAAAIVVYHLSAGQAFGLPVNLATPFILGQGVSFFFVLSGFILTHVYPSLQTVGNRGFLLARFARIWPAHFATLLLLFLVLPTEARNTMSLDPNYSFGTVLLNLSMIHAWIPIIQSYFSFNAVSWSISTEFGFYFCFLLLIRNWERTWWYKLPVVFLLATLMISLANTGHFPPGNFVVPGLIQMNPAGRLFEFTLGMATALFWKYIRAKFNPGLWLGTLLEVVAIGFLLISMYNAIAWSNKLFSWFSWIGPAGLSWLLDGVISAPSFMLVIFVMGWGRGYFSRILSFPIIVLLGEISFSIYLLHQIFLRFYELHTISFIDVPMWLGYSYFWALTLVTAYLVWAVIERPSQRFLLRFGRHWLNNSSKKSDKQIDRPNSRPSATSRGSLFAPTQLWKVGGLVLLLVLLLPVIYEVQVSNTLPQITTLQKNETPTPYDIQLVGDVFTPSDLVILSRANFPEGSFPVSGYAVDGPGDHIARGVLLCIDNKNPIMATYGLSRPDVAKYLKSDNYLLSGFQGKIPLDNLSMETHYLTIKIVSNDGTHFYESRKIELHLT